MGLNAWLLSWAKNRYNFDLLMLKAAGITFFLALFFFTLATPANAQTSPPPGLNADKIFDLINAHRTSKNLPALEKHPVSCELAVSRAPEIRAEIYGGYMHSGLRKRKLPYWNAENIISMRTEEAAVRWWINDYIHRVQLEGNYKYSCVACVGNSCAQEFTNFTPKQTPK